MRRRLIERRGKEVGAAAVEFALVLPLLLLLLFGTIQYGLYFWGMQSGTAATGELVRRLSVGDCTTSDQRQALLVAKLGAASTDSSQVTQSVVYSASGTGATVPAPGVVGGGVQVTVTFRTIHLNLPFVPVPDDGRVTRTYSARLEDVSPSGTCA